VRQSWPLSRAISAQVAPTSATALNLRRSLQPEDGPHDGCTGRSPSADLYVKPYAKPTCEGVRGHGAGHFARQGWLLLAAGLVGDHVHLLLQARQLAPNGGQRVLQLGQAGILRQRAAQVVETVDRRIVDL
jgi:hypothetical protein